MSTYRHSEHMRFVQQLNCPLPMERLMEEHTLEICSHRSVEGLLLIECTSLMYLMHLLEHEPPGHYKDATEMNTHVSYFFML